MTDHFLLLFPFLLRFLFFLFSHRCVFLFFSSYVCVMGALLVHVCVHTHMYSIYTVCVSVFYTCRVDIVLPDMCIYIYVFFTYMSNVNISGIYNNVFLFIFFSNYYHCLFKFYFYFYFHLNLFIIFLHLVCVYQAAAFHVCLTIVFVYTLCVTYYVFSCDLRVRRVNST